MQREGAYPARPPPHPESHHTCLDPPQPPNSVMEKQLGRHLPGSLLGTRPDPRTDTFGAWRRVGVQSPATSQLTHNPDPRGRRAIDSREQGGSLGQGLGMGAPAVDRGPQEGPGPLRDGEGPADWRAPALLDPPQGEAAITGLTRLFSLCPEAHWGPALHPTGEQQ